ncbi:MAG TPA: oxygen-dependent coproporphyrinogen oxidase [Polyangia bacterium]|jgi:coproporphyrinogen III oxidase|nr:oxygen-dependent coproporphyrinogen oxidase [Polyangia bacterium]
MSETIEQRAEVWLRGLQDRICAGLEEEDGTARFRTDEWQRPGGGGGRSRVIENGAVFEKGGVNFSHVHGELRPDFASQLPGEGLSFLATGVSLVLHPRSPMVPAVHANFRCLRRGSALWFGGGADLTPYYPEREDVLHFHRTWKAVCDRHDPEFYARFKKWCDEYFYLQHRGETRGIGGIFFDYVQRDPERDLAFVQDAGDAFLEAYLPVVRRRRHATYGEREREFQLLRRGRYVEFNLIYDRGTVFGLKTDGRTESILMSLPPLVRWGYDVRFEPGTREAALVDWLKPRDWLGEG